MDAAKEQRNQQKPSEWITGNTVVEQTLLYVLEKISGAWPAHEIIGHTSSVVIGQQAALRGG